MGGGNCGKNSPTITKLVMAHPGGGDQEGQEENAAVVHRNGKARAR